MRAVLRRRSFWQPVSAGRELVENDRRETGWIGTTKAICIGLFSRLFACGRPTQIEADRRSAGQAHRGTIKTLANSAAWREKNGVLTHQEKKRDEDGLWVKGEENEENTCPVPNRLFQSGFI